MRVSFASSWAMLLLTGVGCASGLVADPNRDNRGGGGSPTSRGGDGGDAGGNGGGGGQVIAGQGPECDIAPGLLDAPGACEPVEPPSTFELVEKWRYPLATQGIGLGAPLVANLDDDDGDGRIDLCDVPDVLVAQSDNTPPAVMMVMILSGADGTVGGSFEASATYGGRSLAVADLDGDGRPDIVMMDRSGVLRAFSTMGDVLWEADQPVYTPAMDHADPFQGITESILRQSQPAIHDLGGDGRPEIIVGLSVYHANGALAFRDPLQAETLAATADPNVEWQWTAWPPVQPTVADLDGDGRLEVLFGHVAFRDDGTELWRLDPDLGTSSVYPGDFDSDGVPELLMVSRDGVSLVSAVGDVIWGPKRPPVEAEPPRYDCWVHPAALADMDGDGRPEALVNSCEHRMVLAISKTGLEVVRSEPVPLTTILGNPWSGSSAFDFRGSGPDWLAYHHEALTLFAGASASAMSEVHPHLYGAGDGVSFPRVADVDNDGSADVVVANSKGIVVYEDLQRRPSPARRIWNQWNYLPSHIREDARVVAPQHAWEPSFRVQRPLACP